MRISDWSSDVCSSDLQEATGLQVLAAIPRVAPRNVLGPGLWRFLEEEPNSAFAEAHKGISASLRVDRRALELGNVLLVTSSAPNEGKSVFSRRLSAAPAQTGRASCRERGCQYV